MVRLNDDEKEEVVVHIQGIIAKQELPPLTGKDRCARRGCE